MRITFASVPAYGHVLPMVPLATAAAEAGHEVQVGASAAFAERLPVPVFDGVPAGLTLQSAEAEARAEVTDPSDPLAWPIALFGIVTPRYVVPHLLAHWGRHGAPDLVVHESTNVGAAIAAREAGVRSVSFQIALAPPSLFQTRLREVADFPLETLVDPRPDRWRGDETDICPRLPIRPDGWSDPQGARPGWLADHVEGTTAYLTLGTVAYGAVDILRRSIQQTAQRCARVVVAAGPDSDPALLGDLPDHVHVERFVDQPFVLEHADLAVHHGGTGTVLGCLAAGVPQVVTPQGADQFFNAARLEELGLGCMVPNAAPEVALGGAVDRLLTDDALRQRVTEVREEIARMPSPAQALETLLAMR